MNRQRIVATHRLMKFTDSHCHLDFNELKAHLQQGLLVNCVKQHIHRIIVPSITPDNWQQVLSLTVNNNSPVTLYAALGIHPWFLNELDEQALTALSQQVIANKENIIAIGEAGIDGTIADQQDNLAKQQLFFDYQLQLAKTQQLPIIIHHRRSHQHIEALLRKHLLPQAGVIHAFSGSYQQAKHYIDLGYKLGVGGTITYPRAHKTINAIKKLPLDSLVLETDAPAMPLYNFQGQTNTPLQIIKVFNALLAIRSETSEQIAEQLEQNIMDIFAIN